jgi:hypothetical protein
MGVPMLPFAVKKLNYRPRNALTTSHPMKCSGIDQVVHFNLNSPGFKKSIAVNCNGYVIEGVYPEDS